MPLSIIVIDYYSRSKTTDKLQGIVQFIFINYLIIKKLCTKICSFGNRQCTFAAVLKKFVGQAI